MSTPDIIKEEPISMVELKTELSKIRRRDKELNFRANKTDEYVKQFVSIDAKKAQELQEKIESLDIPRLKDIHIKKIVDILPKKPEDLKITLEAYPITISAENQKKIVSVVSEFI